MSKILVTGVAGFIGFHIARRLLQDGDQVVGLDNLNDYYDVSLKRARLAMLQKSAGFRFELLDVANQEDMHALASSECFEYVVHMAAQAGVRCSPKNPVSGYVESNLVGFMNILEICRHTSVRHLIYASSSSVYGANTRLPFSTHDNVDHPLSLYAATKKSNELMAHTYSHLYRLPTTGLRFFTVYGPWGRPDMALFAFTKAILEGHPIDLFNNGDMQRDFTFIDDITEVVMRLMRRVPEVDPTWHGDRPDPASSDAPYRIYNIGTHHAVQLMHLIEILEKLLGRKAKLNRMTRPVEDMTVTCADIGDLSRDIGFRPNTLIEEGAMRFVKWYCNYYVRSGV
ncbi:capsular biosynthesis protein CpsI [Pseudomonas agarici]|uniref:Capsular biosynthesis protein CpsI n=1 Tax=Pseudomonas agarici TaxID=46677 RepID=A0A0X1T157_PSEAA|nr:NAD-dependent epimerase [Pseudomonas agarici]AMB85609.1 capsular biosynthesis protein CpsI [Pseudomonas agarici]NWB90608.1 NAD-dependent epimerase [Pseudomonas agarici]NWC09708.1 NAD-dependent epimerase [Pseudomonas agarici]SEL65333.1 UDP-glucuronate 4-epimerase [Pseudomonas agarici]